MLVPAQDCHERIAPSLKGPTMPEDCRRIILDDAIVADPA